MSNTSTATVSFVLRNKPGVKEDKRKRILQIVRETGYRPNRSARNLVLRKSSTLGFVVANLKNPVYVDVFIQVQEFFRNRGYQILLMDSQVDVEKEKQNIELMLESQVEALIVIPVHDFQLDAGVQHLQAVRDQNIPLLILGKMDGCDVDYVTSEEVQAAYDLTRRLIDWKHRRVAFLRPNPHNRAAIARLEGTAKALAESGLQLYDKFNTSSEKGRGKELDALLAKEDRPTAIVTVNNIFGIQAIQHCKALGLSVPKDVSVVSFDDLSVASVISPSLTTCSVDVERLSQETVEILAAKMANPKIPAIRRLIPQIVHLRESAGPCPKRVKKVR